MPGVGDLWGIWEVKEVKDRPRQTEARELLQKLADQVKPICVAHQWKVPLLLEFVPKEAGLLGMNVNRGQKICIRLRPASDEGNFYPYENLLGTTLHELVHMEIGPHSAKFYKMLDQLTDECDKLIREGITGRNMPFAGEGRSLGGVRGPADARAAALRAAEKRQRQQGILGGGGQRLGGLSGALSSPSDSRSAAQRAADAAQWRAAVSKGCGGHHEGSAAGHAAGNAATATGDLNGWQCGLCTLINAFDIGACDACGTERSAASAGVSIGGGSGGGGGSSSGAVGGGGSRGPANGREKRPAPATGGASRVAGPLKTASTRSAKGGHSLRPPGSSGSGGGGGAPSEATWICLECPFNFPNGAERQTCESCGAARGGKKAASGGGGSGSGNGANSAGVTLRGAAAAAARPRSDRGEHKDLSRWACPKCTLVNAGSDLRCGVCQAERPSTVWQAATATATASAEWAGERIAAGDGRTSMRGDFTSGLSSGGVRGRSTFGGSEPSTSGASSGAGGRDDGVRVCRVCTLRNPSGASECAACGIPLAESEAVAGATTAAPMLGASGAEVWVMDENRAGGGRRGAPAAAARNEPEYIDLS